MGKLSIWDRIRLWIGGIAWDIFIWSTRMTEDEYHESIFRDVRQEFQYELLEFIDLNFDITEECFYCDGLGGRHEETCSIKILKDMIREEKIPGLLFRRISPAAKWEIQAGPAIEYMRYVLDILEKDFQHYNKAESAVKAIRADLMNRGGDAEIRIDFILNEAKPEM